MKLLCTRGAVYFSLALLFVLAAACTQTKPAVPTPTLVPLSTPDLVVPQGGGQPTTIVIPQATPGPGDATAVPPPAEATVAPDGGATPDNGATPDLSLPTALPAQPTLLPTPTTVGDTGQPVPTSTTGGSTTTGGSCSSPYTVKPGEWFLLIARNCGVTPQALQAANPGTNPNLLRPGQVLNIPGGGTSNNAPPPVITPASGGQPPSNGGACTNPYVVQRGDTLFSIATRCGTTVIALQQANNIPAPEYIFPGQTLRIP
jgi:LysM repeat protein